MYQEEWPAVVNYLHKESTVKPSAKAKGKEVASDTLVPTQNVELQWGLLSPKVVASQKEVVGKHIVIGGEDDILVSHLTSFWYINVDGETIETPFQYLEVVNVLSIQQTSEQPKSEPSQGAKAIMEVHENKGRFGLEYQLFLDGTIDQSIKRKIPLVEETFKSVGLIFNGKVEMIEEEAYNEATYNELEGCWNSPSHSLSNIILLFF